MPALSFTANGRFDIKGGRPGILTKDQKRELTIDTMANWALAGMEPDRQAVEDVNSYIDGRITREEFVRNWKVE